MTKKKIITIISSALCVAMVTFGIVSYVNRPYLDDSAQLRDEADIVAEIDSGIWTMDENALNQTPLNSSATDGNLRAQAMSAYNTVNAYRAASGLSMLTWDNNLESAAGVRAVEASQVFSHTRPNGSQWYTVNSRIMSGENLAFGYNTSDAAMSAWMASPTHKYNIMYGKFKKIAISCYRATDGKLYWAQEFGY